MTKRFTSVVLLTASMIGFGACATGVASTTASSTEGAGGQSTGSGGAGGAGGHGGQGGASSAPSGQSASSASATSATSGSSTSSGQGGGAAGQDGGPNLCGNGVLDTGEQCDGNDFGGKTCASIGLGSGTLICNAYCGIVATNCVPKESCSDGQDNDKDGDIDCLDSDCAKAPVCVDSCTQTKILTIPSYTSDNAAYRASAHKGSCTTSSGPEVIYRVTAPAAGTMTFKLSTFDAAADFSLSLRTSCGDDASEVACVDSVHPDGSSDPEVLSRDVTQGETLYVMVDSVALKSSGEFELDIDMPLPEGNDFPGSCSDFADSDGDGRIDCDDPSVCQSLPDCAPGMGVTGSPCAAQTDCAANHNDPICLDDKHGYTGGYCSEFCDLKAPDCAGDAVCADIGLKSLHGVCLDGCVTDADCRAGYACVDRGLPSKVCGTPPESSCDDYQDNDNNGLMDCEDPGCATSPDCVPGSKATGQPCAANNECYSGTTDPFCIDTTHYNYPGGYCSEFCNLAQDDCGPGAICSNWLSTSGSANGLCFHTCVSTADCRAGYSCLDIGASKKACVH